MEAVVETVAETADAAGIVAGAVGIVDAVAIGIEGRSQVHR